MTFGDYNFDEITEKKIKRQMNLKLFSTFWFHEAKLFTYKSQMISATFLGHFLTSCGFLTENTKTKLSDH